MTPSQSENPSAPDPLPPDAPAPPRTVSLQRLLPPVVLLGLLIATAAAFAITERLKLEQSPVYGTQISQYLSSTCGCARGRAKILIKLRHRDAVTLTIRDPRRGLVDTLASGLAARRGVNVFYWNGRTERAGHARDGTYYVEVHLAQQHRTLLLPNRILLDTVPPEIDSATPERPAFSPDGDTQADAVTIRYALSQPAFVLVVLPRPPGRAHPLPPTLRLVHLGRPDRLAAAAAGHLRPLYRRRRPRRQQHAGRKKGKRASPASVYHAGEPPDCRRASRWPRRDRRLNRRKTLRLAAPIAAWLRTRAASERARAGKTRALPTHRHRGRAFGPRTRNRLLNHRTRPRTASTGP